ncbi:MAG: hypothetical protein V4697_04320 [Patescibacteria group bacterium]
MAKKASRSVRSKSVPVTEDEVRTAIRTGDGVGASHVRVTLRDVTRTFQLSAGIVAEAMQEFGGVFNNARATA